jgi:PAS domain S-box-containing protein
MRYRLQDLIDIHHFQQLQDMLSEIYPFPSAIIDNDGNILTATAWQEVCTGFHRTNPEAERICIESDRYILDHLDQANPAVTYRCPHGLVDNAMPIVIDGVHYGNFFTGQFFLEEPDLDFFRLRAEKYGFNEEAYLEAIKKVPLWTKEQLNSYLFFIKGLISIITDSGLAKLKEIEYRKEIENSEEYYRSIVKASMDGYWLTDRVGNILEVNDAYCRMSGYGEHELLTMRVADLEANETPDQVAEHMERLIEKGADRFLSRHRRKDGTVFDVEVSTQCRTGDGNLFVCFLRDITERNQVERALRESEEKFRASFDEDSIGRTLTGIDGRLLRINQRFCTMLGYTPEEMAALSFVDITHPDDMASSHEVVRSLLSGEQHNSRLEKRYLHKDGTPIWAEMTTTLLRDEQGSPLYFITGILDIGERRRASEALRESEANHKLVLGMMQESLSVIDGDGNFLLANPTAARNLTGGDAEELIGKNIRQLVPEEQGRKLLAVYRQVLDSASPVVQEVPVSLPQGDRWFYNTLRPLEYGERKTRALLSISLDITDRKLVEERLRRSEADLKQAQRVAHVGSWAWHIQENRLEWSDEMYRIFDINKETFSGLLSDVIAHSIHPEDRAAVEHSNRSVISPNASRRKRSGINSRPNCSRPRNWKPSAPWPEALPTTSTIFSGPLSVIRK